MMAVLGAIGSVLLFLLKAVLILLGVILGLILLLILIPSSVYLVYENQQWLVSLRVLGIRFRVFPLPSWLERFLQGKEPQENTPQEKWQPQPKEEEPAQSPMEERASAEPKLQKEPPVEQAGEQPALQKQPIQQEPLKEPQAPPQGTKAEPQTQPVQSNSQKADSLPKPEPSAVEKVVALLKTATGAAKISMKGIWVSVWVRWPIQGKDPAATAISFGRWNGWVGGISAVLSNLMQFRLRKLDLIPDFAGEYQGKEKLQAKITASPLMFLIAGVWVLKELKNNKIL